MFEPGFCWTLSVLGHTFFIPVWFNHYQMNKRPARVMLKHVPVYFSSWILLIAFACTGSVDQLWQSQNLSQLSQPHLMFHPQVMISPMVLKVLMVLTRTAARVHLEMRSRWPLRSRWKLKNQRLQHNLVVFCSLFKIRSLLCKSNLRFRSGWEWVGFTMIWYVGL